MDELEIAIAALEEIADLDDEGGAWIAFEALREIKREQMLKPKAKGENEHGK